MSVCGGGDDVGGGDDAGSEDDTHSGDDVHSGDDARREDDVTIPIPSDDTAELACRQRLHWPIERGYGVRVADKVFE